MKNWLKKLVVACALGGLLVPATVHANNKPFDGQTVKVGVTSENAETYWKGVARRAKEQEGINIDVQLFTDYVQPQQSLVDGSIDLNACLGYPFFLNWAKENKADLVSIGNTIISPLALFSKKHQSLEELPEGATIAIPNDPSTYGRAYQALQQAGLIKVDPAAGIFPDQKDILENPKNLKFTLLDPATAALALQDVDAAFINADFAVDAGLDFKKDAIFVDADDLEHVNVIYTNLIGARAKDKDNPLYLKVVELFQTPETKEDILKLTKGSEIPVFDDVTVDQVYQLIKEKDYLK